MTEQRDLTLWDIHSALHDLMDAREEAVDENDAQVAEKAIAEFVNRELVKVDHIANYLRHCQHMADWAREEADRHKARAEAWERRENFLRAATLTAMLAFDRKKIEGRKHKLAITPNGGDLPVIIDDETKVPASCKEVTIITKVSKTKVRGLLMDGQEVDGAHLGERGIHLRVT